MNLSKFFLIATVILASSGGIAGTKVCSSSDQKISLSFSYKDIANKIPDKSSVLFNGKDLPQDGIVQFSSRPPTPVSTSTSGDQQTSIYVRFVRLLSGVFRST